MSPEEVVEVTGENFFRLFPQAARHREAMAGA
jgi:hypothetical protein